MEWQQGASNNNSGFAKNNMTNKLLIHTDGGARGNPGPAATGIIIKNAKGETIIKFGEFLGIQTNNFAEYSAVIAGLKKAAELKAEEIEIISDSSLLVEQLNRNWKVKEPTLQILFVKAWNELIKFKKYKIRHVRRELNKEADAVVNEILDKSDF
jgi:ribonuclease HI